MHTKNAKKLSPRARIIFPDREPNLSRGSFSTRSTFNEWNEERVANVKGGPIRGIGDLRRREIRERGQKSETTTGVHSYVGLRRFDFAGGKRLWRRKKWHKV